MTLKELAVSEFALYSVTSADERQTLNHLPCDTLEALVLAPLYQWCSSNSRRTVRASGMTWNGIGLGKLKTSR